jgi:hypothetical protein
MSMNLVVLILITPSRLKVIMFSETTRPLGQNNWLLYRRSRSGDFWLTRIKVCSDPYHKIETVVQKRLVREL